MLEFPFKNSLSTLQNLEIIYVIYDLKKACRIVGPQSLLNDFIRYFDTNFLHHELSNNSYYPISGTYQNSSKLIHNNHKGEIFKEFYVAKDKILCKTLKVLFEKDQFRKIGTILEYPECCINFFGNYLALGQVNNMNFNSFVAGNGDGSYLINNFLVNNDIGLLSHFPCNINCKQSIEIAQNRLEFLKLYSPQLYSLFKTKLSSHVIILENGIVKILKDKNKVEIFKKKYHNFKIHKHIHFK